MVRGQDRVKASYHKLDPDVEMEGWKEHVSNMTSFLLECVVDLNGEVTLQKSSPQTVEISCRYLEEYEQPEERMDLGDLLERV